MLAGHSGWVRCVAVDHSNEWFLSSGTDRLIKCWDLATGTLKLSLTGHVSPVRALEISPHHPYFYSGGEDNEVSIFLIIMIHIFVLLLVQIRILKQYDL